MPETGNRCPYDVLHALTIVCNHYLILIVELTSLFIITIDYLDVISRFLALPYSVIAVFPPAIND